MSELNYPGYRDGIDGIDGLLCSVSERASW